MGAKEQYEARKAEEKASRQAQKESRWWFNQRLPIDRFTGWLVAWTALLFIATILNAAILWKTDHTLTDTLIANNRAWVWPEVEIASDLDLTSRDVRATVSLTNKGAAPATHVSVELYLIPSGSIAGPGVQEFCQDALKRKFRSINIAFEGIAVFPQTTIISDSGADIWPEKFRAARAAVHTPGSFGYFITLSVCVYYRFAVGGDEYRVTSRRFNVIDTDLYNSRATAAIDPRKTLIKQNKLVLKEDIFGSGYAN